MCYFLLLFLVSFPKEPHKSLTFSNCYKSYKQLEYLHGLIYESGMTCIAELRMDRRSFHRLCQVLVTRGQLRATRNVSIEEMVALFLYILAQHLKNR